MDTKRLKQIIKYGWKHAGQISDRDYSGKRRIGLFIDILRCYRKYRMWSNQYQKANFDKLSKLEREKLGSKFLEEGRIRDDWQKDFQENRRFLLKYTHRKYELTKNREKRNRAYTKMFNAGPGLFVEHSVEITRQHYLPGSIKIGKNVLLAKHVTIDYSGFVEIQDRVVFSEYANVLSHDHTYNDLDVHCSFGHIPSTQSRITFQDDCWLGSNAIILPSCHVVGRGAIVGSGSVCRSNVPPYAIVTGNPAKVVGFRFTVDEIIEIEKRIYPESQRIPRKELEKNYDKYYVQSIEGIVPFLKVKL